MEFHFFSPTSAKIELSISKAESDLIFRTIQEALERNQSAGDIWKKYAINIVDTFYKISKRFDELEVQDL